MGQLTPQPSLCYGSALRALQLVSLAGQLYLPRCLAWTPLLRDWHHLSSQHDVSEFLRHVLVRAQPWAFAGFWEARLANPHVITDQGPLLMPLMMELAGRDLQTVVDRWHHHAPPSIDTCTPTACRSCAAAIETLCVH